jgi:hypothetical protein
MDTTTGPSDRIRVFEPARTGARGARGASPATPLKPSFRLARSASSKWSWHPGVKEGAYAGDNSGLFYVRVVLSGNEAQTIIFSEHEIKPPGGTYQPTPVELRALLQRIEQKEADWMEVAKTHPSPYTQEAIERSAKDHERRVADLRLQIAMTTEG